MTLAQFLGKQFIRVIQWNEPGPGILAWRFPMMDQEIENGGSLTVRESEMAIFVNEGKIADVFGPGLYTLNTQNLPILTDLMNWARDFQSPFKSDVYFFSTHLEIDQKWGTATPITLRDKEFGAIRLRSYGIYSYRITAPRTFFTQVSGTRESYFVYDLEDHPPYEIGNRYEHLAVEVDGDLPAFVDRLRTEGVKVLKDPKKSPGGTRWIAFVEDPNGIPVELLEPRPGKVT